MFQLILTNSLIVVFLTQGAMFHETLFGTGAQSTAIGSEAQRPSTQNDSLCTTWNSGYPHC